MADILLMEGADVSNSDDVEFGDGDCRLLNSSLMDGGGEGVVIVDKDGSVLNPYDFCIPPVESLEKYISDHKTYNKRAVAQAVLETLRIVRESPTDVRAVLQILSSLAEDSDSQLRTEVMVQVPQIAMLCYEVVEQLAGVVEGHLLPMVIKTLTDIEDSVRTTAQTALIVLMEQNLVTHEAIEKQVCPVILMLAEMGTLPDYHSSAVTLMSKIAPLVGREKAMALFLNDFVVLCSDPAFFVRTVCATNIGDFCTLMGTEVTERILLGCFVELCKDSVWGVRKECADVFLSVSCVVSLETRKKVLAPIFVELLRDQSRWVKIAAFHSLGPFIWTFASDSNKHPESQVPENEPTTPQKSSLSQPKKINPKKILRLRSESSEVSAEFKDSIKRLISMITPVINNSCDTDSGNVANEKAGEQLSESDSSDDSNENVGAKEKSESCDSTQGGELENDFNTFLFWRLPLPDVGPNLTIDGVGDPDKGLTAGTGQDVPPVSTSSAETGDQAFPSLASSDQSFGERETMDWSSPNRKYISVSSSKIVQVTGMQSPSSVENKGNSSEKPAVQVQTTKNECREHNVVDEQRGGERNIVESPTDVKEQGDRGTPCMQDIVPQSLIDLFVSMSAPSQYYEDEAEFAHHCAFNLPAVALTLGRENWHLLSSAYEDLAADVQWKVRRTLASSIHELAVILGEELATRYLVPIFNGFIKDLDEVRIGVVKHLADFLKLVSPVGRNECLPALSAFLKTDNQLNWRFREELTKQLLQVTNLFTPTDVKRFLIPFGLSLLADKVAAVRKTALLLVTQHVRYLSVNEDLVESLLVTLANEFGANEHWMKRQSYAFFCECLLCPPLDNRIGKEDEDEDDDDDDEGGGDLLLDDWIEDGEDKMAWRTRIASLLAEHVYPYLLNLSNDEVPNVRLAVARVLDSLQPTPTELNYLQSYTAQDHAGERDEKKCVPELEKALARLQKDPDRDVREAATLNRPQCTVIDVSKHLSVIPFRLLFRRL